MHCLATQTDPCPESFIDFTHVYNITEDIKCILTGFLSKSSENQEVEGKIFTEGKRILNAIHQAFFDAKSRDIVVEPVIDKDSVERKHVRNNRSRIIKGIHGEVKIHRKIYRGDKTSSLKPLEGYLNLPKDKYSFALKKHAVSVACEMSYEKTQQLLMALTSNTIPKRQLEEILIKASKDYEQFYELSGYCLDDYDPSDLLILTFDGKGIRMIPDSLREQTRVAAKKQKKSGVRLGKGEKTNRKRMAQVAGIYTISRYFRTSDDILSSLRKTKTGQKAKRPSPQRKRIFASIERSAETVITEGIEEALRRDQDRNMSWFVLVDGCPRQIKSIEKILKAKNCKATIIMDFIHVTEYVWKAAHAIWGEKNQPDKEEWVFEILDLILRGKAKEAVRSLYITSKIFDLSESEQKLIASCCTYLKNHYKYLKYHNSLQAGAPICTGIIEGACRYLIRDRMELTGCRWSLKGAEAMLCMRSIKVSGDFEKYWKFHCDKEKQRNHLELYKDQRLPSMAMASTKPTLKVIPGGKSCAH
jgi:hypothetical protein